MITNIIIPKELTDPVLKWTNDFGEYDVPQDHEGTILGFRHLDKSDQKIKSLIKKIDTYILKQFQLKAPINKDDGYWIAISKKDSKVKIHKDPKPKDGSMIRFNLLLQKSTKGGIPVINDKKIKVKENQVWICEASKYYHSTTKVQGNKDRIILSLGHTVKDKDLNKLGL